MSKREAYSDTFTGEADRGIRAVLGFDDEDESGRKLRRLLLKVINTDFNLFDFVNIFKLK